MSKEIKKVVILGDSSVGKSSLMYRNSDAAILAYDITREDSLKNCKLWKEEVVKSSPKCLFFLCGCKSDLDTQRIVQTLEAENFGNDLNCLVSVETSSKLGENVNELFEFVSKKLARGGVVAGSSMDVDSLKQKKDNLSLEIANMKRSMASELINKEQELRSSLQNAKEGLEVEFAKKKEEFAMEAEMLEKEKFVLKEEIAMQGISSHDEKERLIDEILEYEMALEKMKLDQKELFDAFEIKKKEVEHVVEIEQMKREIELGRIRREVILMKKEVEVLKDKIKGSN